MKKASFSLFVLNALFLMGVVFVSQTFSSRNIAATNAVANSKQYAESTQVNTNDISVADTASFPGIDQSVAFEQQAEDLQLAVKKNMTPITVFGLVSTIITGGIFVFSMMKPKHSGYNLANKYKYAR